MIYSIVNQKGGTGKTTTTMNLGCALARYNNSVLLIDFDPQGNLSFSFGLGGRKNNIEKLLAKEASLSDVICKIENLDIIPASIKLANAEINLINKNNREYKLSKLIKQLDYDYILIDCPPSLSVLTINALTASDKVLIPLQLEVLSVKGLDLVLGTIEGVRKNYNNKIEIEGILPVMVDKRKKLTDDIITHIRENYNAPIFKSHIRTNVKASEAPSFGKSVLSYAPKSSSALDYKNLAKEIMVRRN